MSWIMIYYYYYVSAAQVRWQGGTLAFGTLQGCTVPRSLPDTPQHC